jgi:hypothetical protein
VSRDGRGHRYPFIGDLDLPLNQVKAVHDRSTGVRDGVLVMRQARRLVRPGEPGGRYVCELLVSLPVSSA